LGFHDLDIALHTHGDENRTEVPAVIILGLTDEDACGGFGPVLFVLQSPLLSLELGENVVLILSLVVCGLQINFKSVRFLEKLRDIELVAEEHVFGVSDYRAIESECGDGVDGVEDEVLLGTSFDGV